LNKRLQHSLETLAIYATCAKFPIYFCNIHIKHLQHTFKTSETLETYASTCAFSAAQHLLTAWENGGSSACGVHWKQQPDGACRLWARSAGELLVLGLPRWSTCDWAVGAVALPRRGPLRPPCHGPLVPRPRGGRCARTLARTAAREIKGVALETRESERKQRQQGEREESNS
jgi:hypothetical protein